MQWIMEKGNWYENLLNAYKKELRFVSAELDLVDETVPQGRFIATVKYDGELTAAVMMEECGATYNRYGRVRWDFPANAEFLSLAAARGLKSVIAFCELYAVSPEGKPLPLNETMSIIKKPVTPEREAQIRIAVFDIYSVDDQVLYGRTSYEERFLVAHDLFRDGRYVHAAAGRDFETGDKVISELWQKHVLDENYEGLVIRANKAIKIKPRFSIDLAVVGFFEGKGRLAGTLGGVVTAFMTPLPAPLEDQWAVPIFPGEFLFAGRVGTGFDDKERAELWKDLNFSTIGRKETLKGSRNGFGQPGNIAVEPRMVIEVEASNFVRRDVDAMVWDHENGMYLMVCRNCRPGWTLQQPRFIRIREDKQIDPADLRLEQVPIVAP